MIWHEPITKPWHVVPRPLYTKDNEIIWNTSNLLISVIRSERLAKSGGVNPIDLFWCFMARSIANGYGMMYDTRAWWIVNLNVSCSHNSHDCNWKSYACFSPQKNVKTVKGTVKKLTWCLDARLNWIWCGVSGLGCPKFN